MPKLSDFMEAPKSAKLASYFDETPETVALPQEAKPSPIQSALKQGVSTAIGPATAGAAAVGGVALGALGGRGAIKIPHLLARTTGGLSERALETAREVGLDEIKRIGGTEAAKGEYISKEIIPGARRNVVRLITEGTDDVKLYELGFTPPEIDEFRKIPKTTMQSFSSQLSKDPVTAWQSVRNAQKAVGKKIGKVYDIADKYGMKVTAPSAYSTMRTTLKEMGLVDVNGNILQNEKMIPHSSIKRIMEVYDDIHQSVKGTGEMSIPQYRNYISRLEGAVAPLEGKGSQFNVKLFKAIRAFRRDGVKALKPIALFRDMPIDQLNSQYSNLLNLEELMPKISKAINEKTEGLINTFNKIKNEINSLPREKATRLYGADFVKKVERLAASMELYPSDLGSTMRYAGRQATKGLMRARDAVRRFGVGVKTIAPGAIKGLAGGPLGVIIDKLAIKASGPIYIPDSFSGIDDIEKAVLEMNGFPTDNLAPKGSEERKIQLGQIV